MSGDSIRLHDSDDDERSGIVTRPAAIALAHGTMVTPNLRLVQPIASGGMSSLWVADHLGLDTQVAVKFMDPLLARRHADVGERFKREASISARIRSVHAVQVFDQGHMPDGTPYIVMELLEGCTLDEWVEARGAVTLRECAQVIAQLAKVLQRAHQLDIVHRDLKPENVFVVDSDYELFVKLLDFGIAKQGARAGGESEVTKTGIAVGTPGYISPEQALNAKKVDHRSDLWALGALAYWLLTNTLPFGDDESEEPWWLRLSKGSFTPVTQIIPALPQAIDGWFRRALESRPERRFQSAQEMAETLLAIAALYKSVEPPPPASDALVVVEDALPSARPAQFDLFEIADDRTDDGTLVMPEAPAKLPEPEEQVLNEELARTVAMFPTLPTPTPPPDLQEDTHDGELALHSTVAGRRATIAVVLAAIAIAIALVLAIVSVS
jgi:eukaryotic-like serine/threonine-protein kinase